MSRKKGNMVRFCDLRNQDSLKEKAVCEICCPIK